MAEGAAVAAAVVGIVIRAEVAATAVVVAAFDT